MLGATLGTSHISIPLGLKKKNKKKLEEGYLHLRHDKTDVPKVQVTVPKLLN